MRLIDGGVFSPVELGAEAGALRRYLVSSAALLRRHQGWSALTTPTPRQTINTTALTA